MIIIGIGHKARQGKDTLARTLVIEAGKRNLYAKQYGFADALKTVCRIQYGMRAKNPTLLQNTGVFYRDNISPNFWVHQLDRQIADERPEIAIITDIRFQNEHFFIKETGGYTVRITRFLQDGSLYVANDRDPLHISETALSDDKYWDYSIANTAADLMPAHAESLLDQII